MDTVDLLPNSILSLSGRAADKLLALGDPDAALVYLHILRHNAPPALNWDGPRLQAALDKLAAQKLIAPAQAAPAAPAPEQEVPVPEYSLSDVTAALSGSSPFSALADEVERRLGKKLSTPDLKALLTIYDRRRSSANTAPAASPFCPRSGGRPSAGPGRASTPPRPPRSTCAACCVCAPGRGRSPACWTCPIARWWSGSRSTSPHGLKWDLTTTLCALPMKKPLWAPPPSPWTGGT